MEKSKVVVCADLRSAIDAASTEIALHPRANDHEGWRIQGAWGGPEMTLEEAVKFGKAAR